MSQYVAAVPNDGLVPDNVHAFFKRFYQISDNPDGHDTYAGEFTPDATLVMGSNSATGTEAIVRMRHGMWEKVATRSHYPEKIFAFGSGSDEFMLYGNVDYTLKDGRSTNVQWAARARFANMTGELKMSHYQVYLDTAAMAAAK